MTCLLDARQFVYLNEVISTIIRVKTCVGNEAALFFINFPVVHVQLWRDVLQKTFSEKKGYLNVVHYYLDDEQSGESSGVGIIFFRDAKASVSLSNVAFLHTPPDIGFCKFGDIMFYVELQFRQDQKGLAQPVGVLWVPDLYCIEKPYFSDANYMGAFDLIKAALVCQRYESLFGMANLDLATASQRVKAHLAGTIVITDMRSHYFGDRWPIHMYKMSGLAHAVQGSVVDSEFRDAFAHDTLCIAPSCYKIRLCSEAYWVINKSIDFWSELISAESLRVNQQCFSSQLHVGESEESSNLGSEYRSGSARLEENWCMLTLDGNSSVIVAPSAGGSAHGVSESCAGVVALVVREEVAEECMVCLSRLPTCIFEKCGHFGVCWHCAKWMLKEQFNKHKPKGSQISPASLKMSKIANLKIICPYCRQLTRVFHCSKFSGIPYVV